MFSLAEISDMIIMTVAIGYIFGDILPKLEKPRVIGAVSHDDDPIEKYNQHFKVPGLDWRGFKFAVLVVGLAILLHEMGHKFMAMGFGLNATFHANIPFLVLGVVIKLLGFPFFFIAPAYVSYPGSATILQNTLIAFAGPFVHLLLFAIASLLISTNILSKKTKKKYLVVLFMVKKINLILFGFNMIPIPGFDGAKVFGGILSMIRGVF